MLKTILSAGAVSALALSTAAFAQTTATPTSTPPHHRHGTSAPGTTPTDTPPVSTPTPGTGPTGTTTTGDLPPGTLPPATEPEPTTTAPPPQSPPTTEPASDGQPPRADAGAAASGDEAPAGTIAAAVAANADLSTLENALTATDVAATLGQPGPFTVFAPTNEAFNLIPANTRTALMDPANKEALATILKFHVVQGNVTADGLRQQIAAGGGTAHLQTVAGQQLTATLEGNVIALTGENNSKAYITTADLSQSNGTVHVVNGILVPRLG